MNLATVILIFGMFLVTFIPRTLPAFVVDKMRFGRKFEKFIRLIPFTAMTALIFPGILSVDADRWYIGVIGGAVAIFVACFKKIPSAVAIICSVAAVMLTYALI